MKNIDQQDPAESVICDHSDKVVDSSDQRSGSNGRVHSDFVEKHGDQGSDQAGDHHGNQEGKTDTGGYGKGVRYGSALGKMNI